MSDFKFACPACGQRLSANDDYVGHQINCPSCQAAITVPPNPSAPPAEPVRSSIAIATPPGMPPPPAPPKVARLSVSALNEQPDHAAGASSDLARLGMAGYQSHKVLKTKKSYSGVMTAVVAVVLIAGSAYLNRDWLQAKWKSWRGPTAEEKAAVAAAAAAAAKPVEPPELTASEIMQKVVQVYKGLPSFTSTVKSTAIIDLSAVSPALAAAGPKTVSSEITLKMNKPLSFRVDMTTLTATSNATVMGWDAGNGAFLQSGSRRTKVASEDELFSRFTSGSSIGLNVGVGDIIRLFLDGTKPGLDDPNIQWARGTDAKLNDQQCYVLAGTVKLQPVMIWVNRRTFLIPQTSIVLQAVMTNSASLDDDQMKAALKDWQRALVKLYRLDDAQIKEELKAENNGKDPTLLQVDTVKKWRKTTSTVVDMYDNIQTNITIAMTDLVPAAPVAPARATAPEPMQGGGGGAVGGGGGRGGGRRGR